MNVVLNDLQRLIYHKKTTNQPTNQLSISKKNTNLLVDLVFEISLDWKISVRGEIFKKKISTIIKTARLAGAIENTVCIRAAV